MFARKAVSQLSKNSLIDAVAVAGSWTTNEIDEYSDIDFIILTRHDITDNISNMIDTAQSIEGFISGFRGDHVGEPRLLICLYDDPLLHVDFKFITKSDISRSIEIPVILWERDGIYTRNLEETTICWPNPDYQWIEDRFWTWIHYGAGKIARGEYFEASWHLMFMINCVIGPLYYRKHNLDSRSLRKLEKILSEQESAEIISLIPAHDKASLIRSLFNIMEIYEKLAEKLFDRNVIPNKKAQAAVKKYCGEKLRGEGYAK